MIKWRLFHVFLSQTKQNQSQKKSILDFGDYLIIPLPHSTYNELSQKKQDSICTNRGIVPI